jgi:protein-glutamine gamma-glutamyltransferase
VSTQAAKLSNTSALLSPMQFQWSVAALAAASLPAMLWLHWSVSVWLAAILGLRTATARRAPQAWHGAIRLLLVIAAFLLVISTYGSFFGRGPGGALLLSMMALKATESASTRDARLLVTVSLFMLIASFLMTQSFVALILSIFATIVCFAALEVLARPAVGGPLSSPLGRLGSKEVLTLLSLALPVTLCLWLLFPRLATPLWGTNESGSGRSGLSDTMKPNDIRELLTDDSPMMRIRFEDGARPAPSSLYFRGPVLWNLMPDGEWNGNEVQRSQLTAPPAPQPADLRYEVILEPTDQRLLFAADQAVSVSEGSPGADTDAQVPVLFNSEQRFFRVSPIADLLRYQARSRLASSVPAGRYSDQERRWALRLPPERNPRSIALGQALAAQYSQPSQIVQAVLAMFREQDYRYTLLPPETLGIHTTDEFLFDTRAGFCQHYASSFATVLRAAGVPTRVTTGFAGGQYLDAGYFLVTKARAHAWNEVLIDGLWQRVDPTAEIPASRVDPAARRALGEDQSAFMRSLREQRDQLADWWNRTVLNFNAARQANLFKPFGFESVGWQTLVTAMAGSLGFFALLWAAWLYLRDRTTLHPVPKYYQQILRKLARQGLAREPSEGAQSYSNRLAQLHAEKPVPRWLHDFQTLSADYVTLSYAGELPGDGTAESMQFVTAAKALLRKM